MQENRRKQRQTIAGRCCLAASLALLLLIAIALILPILPPRRDPKEVEVAKVLRSAGASTSFRGGRLKTVCFNGASVTERELSLLKGLRNLRELDLSDTQVTDAGLKHIEGLPKLEYLYLDGTSVSDAGMASLKTLPALWFLSLEGTRVTDSGLEHLRELENLGALHLRDTDVTREGVQSLEHRLQRTTIYWCPTIRKSDSRSENPSGRRPDGRREKEHQAGKG